MARDGQKAIDEALHEAEVESLERTLVELALERTGARDGAVFSWDKKQKGLVVAAHVSGGVVVDHPGVLLRHRDDGRPNGIALWVHQHGKPYLCNDASADENYASYFQDAASVAAAPIRYQSGIMGVLSVSSGKTHAFTRAHLDALEELTAAAAKFLRRALLFRASREATGRPFLIKGLSREWLAVERQLEQVAPTDAPVLVHGESGTGKELTAHALHFNSRRAGGPFVPVNCAAIPETLLESVLFGHVKGAFTGASANKVGELEKADGGTLFLDEVGELPLSLQPKLLRAMESGELQPLGSNDRPRRVDVRIVCATNRDLPAMVRQGQFRDDLYYRLAVFTLELPPLRAYKDNLDLLAQVFLQQAAIRHRRPASRPTPAFLAALHAYDFPGNMRELKNAMEHAVIMAGGQELVPGDLPRSFRPPVAAAPPAEELSKPRAGEHPTLEALREATLAPVERAYLEALMEACDGNVREAARRAEVNAVTLYRLLDRRGLKLRRRAESA